MWVETLWQITSLQFLVVYAHVHVYYVYYIIHDNIVRVLCLHTLIYFRICLHTRIHAPVF